MGLALAIFQQFIGVNTVIYYSATIFTYTGLGTSTSVLRALFVGITNVVATNPRRRPDRGRRGGSAAARGGAVTPGARPAYYEV